jgi:3-methyladenine DNA glycosylase AlkD
MSKLSELQKETRTLANPEKSALLMRFFKTGKGEYAEGDIFLGIMVPESRKISLKYFDFSLPDTEKLLHSKFHEERLIALFILIYQFEKGDESAQKKIFSLYIANTQYINNWDLIDITAPKIIGEFLFRKGKGIDVLRKMACSKSLWERRIAILATFQYIKNNRFEETLEIAEKLLFDPHDLIHKAVGWGLREVGKRDQALEEEFLKKHAKEMPRTMLRYAIEKFPEEKRKIYLNRKIEK